MRILKQYFIYFLGATITITLFSGCSPLKVINPYSDINIYLTIGRNILDGGKLYTSLFDHKGPLLYFLYTIACFISRNTFFGVYLIEIISLSIFLIYSDKILKLIFNTKCEKYEIYLSLCAIIIVASNAFNIGGGTVEELFLPFFQITNYICLNRIMKNDSFTPKDCILIGLFASISFLSKFTLSGYYLGVGICLIIYQFNKDRTKLLSCCEYTIFTFLLVFSITSIYFVINHNFDDFINTYFIFNLFNYQKNDSSLIIRLLKQFNQYLFYLKKDTIFVSLSLIGLATIFIKFKKSYESLFFFMTFIMWNTFTFAFCSTRYSYYVLPIAVYIIFVIVNFNNQITKLFIHLLYVCICLFDIYFYSNLASLNKDKNDYVQYDFINIIGDSSFLVYKGYDNGFYFVGNETPACKYFTKVNGYLSDYESSTSECIYDNQIEYIISQTTDINLDNYYLLKEKDGFYLYKSNKS